VKNAEKEDREAECLTSS